MSSAGGALEPMRRAISEAIKDARYAARNRRIKTYVVSFPKTGRTWLRMMVGKAIAEARRLSDARVLDTYKISRTLRYGPVVFSHGGRRHLLDEGPFDELRFDAELYGTKRVLFLVRDVRDTLVSYYFQLARREQRFDGALSSFLRDARYGAPKIVRFYTLWYENRHVLQAFRAVSYEQLRAETVTPLREVLEFLGLDGDLQLLATKAADYASFENMRKMERGQQFDRRMMQPGDPADKDSYKVRKGRVGGFVEYFSQEDLQYIDAVVADHGHPQCNWYFHSPA